MNFGLIKSGVQLIAGMGAGLIADEALKKVAPPALKGLKGVAVKVGSAAISMLAVDRVSKYVGDTIDDTVTEIKNVFKPKVEEDQKESEEA